MIEFGATLRRAREAKGLTTNELAQQTHLMVQQVEALEREDFSKIAAPIYGRGFVKLYCEAVGLDAKPMVAEFMEIFSGNRAVVINKKERAPKVEEKPASPLPPPIDDSPIPSMVEESSLASEEPTTVPSEEPPFADDLFASPEPQQSIPTPKPTPPSKLKLTPPQKFDSRSPSRYTKPQPIGEESESHFAKFNLSRVPRHVWRLIALGVAALIILWLLIAGLRALYCASMNGDPQQTASATNEETASPKNDRSLKTILPLYID